MPLISAGLLMYRVIKGYPEVFLVHPGGPFFKNKDKGYWTIPKGLQENEEDLLTTAQREFKEETGITAEGSYIELGFTKLKGGKIIHAWAFETKLPSVNIISNTFRIEWPPKSGKMQDFPEIDKADFFSLEEAPLMVNEAQSIFFERLREKIVH